MRFVNHRSGARLVGARNAITAVHIPAAWQKTASAGSPVPPRVTSAKSDAPVLGDVVMS